MTISATQYTRLLCVMFCQWQSHPADLVNVSDCLLLAALLDGDILF